MFKNKILWGTQKRPRYRPETASAVLMKYLVESDKNGQAEPPCWSGRRIFQKHCSNSRKCSSLPSKHLQVKNICDCIWSGNDRNFKRPSLRIHQNILLTLQMNLGYNETAFWDANSAPPRASEFAQMNSSTSSKMATYHQQFPSQLNTRCPRS